MLILCTDKYPDEEIVPARLSPPDLTEALPGEGVHIVQTEDGRS